VCGFGRIIGNKMAKKNKKMPTGDPVGKETNPYELKTDAVDRLVNAEKKEYPKLTLENDPRREYRKGFLDRIPSWVKALFIKFWFNGAVCFFIFWGLGILISNMEDMIIVLAIVMGMVTDILVNNIFRFYAVTDGANDKWMMFPKKRFASFFFNILYSFGLLLAVIWIYNVINVVANAATGTEAVIYLGVEPILFGLFYMAIDLLFIAMKNTAIKIVADAKKKNGVK